MGFLSVIVLILVFRTQKPPPSPYVKKVYE